MKANEWTKCISLLLAKI